MVNKRDILGGFFVTLTVFFLIEAAPRLFFKFLNFPHSREFLVKDSYLGWKLKPNYHKKWIHINSLGFRGREVSLQKPSDTCRIAAVGESSTFGMSDDENSPYPAQLQKDLNLKKAGHFPYDFEVINAGVEKYFSWQILRHFKKDVIPMKPDIVIFYMGWNDLYGTDPETSRLIDPESFFNRLIEKSLTLRLLTVFVYRFVMPRFEDLSSERVLLYRNFKPGPFSRNYREIVQLAERNHIGVVMVTLPSLLAAGDLEAHHRRLHFPYFTHDVRLLKLLWLQYNHAIRRISREENITLVDLDKKFRNVKRMGSLFLDTLHTDARGNRIIARSLKEKMDVLCHL